MKTITDLCRTALAERSLLAALPEDAREALIAAGWSIAFPPGGRVHAAGDPCEMLLVLVAGRVRLSRRIATAREVPLRLLGPGDVDGDLAILDGGPHATDAHAIEGAEAVAIYRRDVLRVLEQHPRAMSALVQTLAARLRAASAESETLEVRATGMVAHALLRLADQYGRPLADGILIDHALSPNDLAKRSGLERDVASRRLSHLRDLGIVRPEGTRIAIRDPDGLQDYAEAAGE